MFSAEKPIINWHEVAEKGLQVYIDFSGKQPRRARELKFFWVWESLMEYLEHRGVRGKKLPPLAVVVDELTYFTRGHRTNTKVIIEDFREFLQVRRRNANVWFVGATQDEAELPLDMRRACLQLG